MNELKDDSLHSFVGGGYVISSVNKGKQSVVKHMLAIDWKCWRSYLKSSSAYSITIQMLGRVAGSLLLLTSLYYWTYNYFISLDLYVLD